MEHTVTRAAYPMNEACELLGGVTRQHLYNLEAKGLLRIVRLGRRALIPADEIRRLVGESDSTHDNLTASS